MSFHIVLSKGHSCPWQWRRGVSGLSHRSPASCRTESQMTPKQPRRSLSASAKASLPHWWYNQGRGLFPPFFGSDCKLQFLQDSSNHLCRPLVPSHFTALFDAPSDFCWLMLYAPAPLSCRRIHLDYTTSFIRASCFAI